MVTHRMKTPLNPSANLRIEALPPGKKQSKDLTGTGFEFEEKSCRKVRYTHGSLCCESS